MKKLLLIDTYNFLFRAYHALPSTFKDANGEPTNAVYGVTSMLINVFEQIKPDYAVAALDGAKPTFRVEDFTGYKAHRKPMDAALEVQIPKVYEILDAFGIKRILTEGYEADDVIGTLCARHKKDLEIIIVSNDRDLWQLIDKNVLVMSPTTKGETEWIGAKEVMARFGFEPKYIPDYKGLRGDPSDNIPGVFGVGEKTAMRLVQKYKTVEEIYKHIAQITPVSLKEKLANCAEQAVLSKKLASIITDTPFDISLENCRYREINKIGLVEVLKKYNFKSLIKRLGFDVKESKAQEVLGNQLKLI